ncbi:GH1 family beta-glucosidase [Thiolinea disciformis]|uniref:GH1 family beta-glucosidase n=1 Tax=Thiolinea disciformis TaxID=125614 RepID=UPI00036CCCC9|nr:GH1 family beta-glucosidase [Thiolinea disciformis]
MASFTVSRHQFPSDFEFGVATAAYQIEGSRYGHAGLSHWDTFAATPNNVLNGDDGSIACDHYHRWPEDLDLIQEGGFNSYRFSTSWARIQPEGKGSINQQGLDFYERLVDGLLTRNLKPYLTLYHWDLPAAFSNLGGWRNPDIVHWFSDYSQIVMNRLGDRIAATATFNEPWCITWLSHFLGIHAPGLRDIQATTMSIHNLLRAHGTALQALRADGHNNLGIVLNFDYAQAADESEANRKAADLYDAIFNRLFIQALTQKSYPTVLLAHLERYLPKNYQQDFDTIAQPLDWLGVNYYTRHVLEAAPNALFPAYQDAQGHLPKTDMGWEIYPEGIYHFLTWLHQNYTAQTPLYITENGMAAPDKVWEQGVVQDLDRIHYIDAHLQQVNRAIEQGAPVKGYFSWSLMDNFEWAAGYAKRFGLVHVDYETLKRTPKASWYEFKQFLSV